MAHAYVKAARVATAGGSRDTLQPSTAAAMATIQSKRAVAAIPKRRASLWATWSDPPPTNGLKPRRSRPTTTNPVSASGTDRMRSGAIQLLAG